MFYRKFGIVITAIWNRLLERWGRIRLVQRLIIVVLLFLIIPVLAIGSYLFSIALPLAQKESRETLQEVVYQLDENIQYRITGYQNILAQLAFDPRLSVTLTEDYSNLSDAVDGLQQINSLLERVNTYFPMRSIRIYKSNSTLPEDGGRILNMERANKEVWYKAMSGSGRKQFYWYFDWNNSNGPSLHVSTWLIDYLSNESYGIIKLEIPCRIIFENMSNPLKSKHGWIMLLNGQGKVLADSQDKKAGDDAGNLSYINEVYKNDKGWFITKVNGKQTMIVYETNKLGWKVISLVSQEELWQRLQFIKNAALIVSVLFVVLTFIVLMSFGLRLSKRLNRLVKSMRKVRDGNLGLTVKVDGKDEMAELEIEFNAMSVQLDRSLKELSDAKARVETEKLRLLQAQINPHFLYNTLALVKCMAMDIGSSAISDIIDALSRFFRLALNRGSDILIVREELEHIKAYLEIHEQRYPNRVVITYDISEDVLHCELIKMTLQPIVENALKHAFVQTEGYGQMTIEAYLMEGDLFLRVHDNGIGMTPGQIDELLNESPGTKSRTGFGVYNVNERLKRYFGEKYGLCITSTFDSGTSVEIRVPVQVREEEATGILQNGDDFDGNKGAHSR